MQFLLCLAKKNIRDSYKWYFIKRVKRIIVRNIL